LLPEVMRRTIVPGTPMGAALDVMEGLHAPSEAVLQRIDRVFDPYDAPPGFLPVLARWVDLAWLLDRQGTADAARPGTVAPSLSTGDGRLRELIAAAAWLAQRRGTSAGLVRFLETATGLGGFRIEENPPDEEGRARPFHLRVRAPAAAQVHDALVRRIVDAEKPAYVTWELAFETAAP
jgi:phage tail-like protein